MLATIVGAIQAVAEVPKEGVSSNDIVTLIFGAGGLGALILTIVKFWLARIRKLQDIKDKKQDDMEKELIKLREEVRKLESDKAALEVRVEELGKRVQEAETVKGALSSTTAENMRMALLLVRAGIDPLSGKRFEGG